MSVSTQIKQSTGGDKLRAILSAAPLRIAILVICFIWTLPTVGLFISSFRPPDDLQASGWWTVFAHPFETTQWTLQNYQNVLTADRMGDAFLNSLLVTIPSVVIPITIAAFAAYAFAWLEFPGRNLFFVIVVGLMVVPLQMALIPMLRLYTRYDLNGTYLGVWLAHTGFGLPLAVYLLYGYISTLPGEIIESAHIDGASPFTTFTRLILPLSVPVIAAFAIFQFLWVWNDLLVALVFLGTSREVFIVSTRLAELVGQRGQDWHVLTAGAFITMTIPLIVLATLSVFIFYSPNPISAESGWFAKLLPTPDNVVSTAPHSGHEAHLELAEGHALAHEGGAAARQPALRHRAANASASKVRSLQVAHTALPAPSVKLKGHSEEIGTKSGAGPSTMVMSSASISF